MRVIVSYPGNFMHAQQAARAFYEHGTLTAFATGLAVDDRSIVNRLSAYLPARLDRHVQKELRRREITEVPPNVIVSYYPWLEILRSMLSRYARNPIWADVAWDVMSHAFDRAVSRRLEGVHAVHAFEYTAR